MVGRGLLLSWWDGWQKSTPPCGMRAQCLFNQRLVCCVGDATGAKFAAAASLLIVPLAWGAAAVALLLPACQVRRLCT